MPRKIIYLTQYYIEWGSILKGAVAKWMNNLFCTASFFGRKTENGLRRVRHSWYNKL